MPGPNRVPAGVKSQVKNPMAIFRRLMSYVTKRYLVQWIIVIVLIFASVLANVQGTMFMQMLIDDYITPMLGQSDPDFGSLPWQSQEWLASTFLVWLRPLLTTEL